MDFDLRATSDDIASKLERESYSVELKDRTNRVVERVMVVFPGLLHDLGLSPHRSQRLAVRVEVDTRPPAGAALTTTIVRRHVLLNLQHHDRASLLAGKLHAILERQWAKGRDLFDLFWYLSDPRWPGPNLVLLNNALRQTGWDGSELDESGWRSAVRNRIASLDWAAAERDAAPFLGPGPATSLFGRDSLMQLLQSAA